MNLLPVQSFQETLHQSMCGPAVLHMILKYYDIFKDESELAKLASHDPSLGIDDSSIKKVAEQHGLKVEIKDFADFSDIQQWLDQKVPVIVNWFTKGRADYNPNQVADGHYSIVVGLDVEKIYLQDPEIGGIREIDREDFKRVWFDFRGETIDIWENMIIRQLIAIYK